MNKKTKNMKVGNSKKYSPSKTPKKNEQAKKPKSLSSADKNRKVCRICLEEGDINSAQNSLITPCQCSGSVEFVHEQCLCQWINTVLEKKEEMAKHAQKIECQLCKKTLQFKSHKRIVCLKSEERRKIIKQQKRLLYFSLGITPLFLLMIAALVFVQVKVIGSSKQYNGYIIAGYVLVAVAIILSFTKIFFSFFITFKKQVFKILSKNNENVVEEPQLLNQEGHQSRKNISRAVVDIQEAPNSVERN